MTPEEIAAAAEAARIAAEKAAADKAAADAAKTPEQLAAEKAAADKTNADHAAQRLLKKANDRVAELEAAEQKRKDAELSETDRLKKEAADARSEAEAAKLDAMRLKAGKDLPEEAMQFLTAADPDALAAQAETLRGLYGKQNNSQAVQGGTRTQPPGGQQPTTQERIATARNAGNIPEAIRLMREDQFKDK